MDKTDFEGLTKYKLFIPLLYITSWICMFVIPSFFPELYQRLMIVIMMYLLFKISYILLTCIYIAFKSKSQINRAKPEEQNNYASLTDIR